MIIRTYLGKESSSTHLSTFFLIQMISSFQKVISLTKNEVTSDEIS